MAALYALLRAVAQRHRPHTEIARRGYLGDDDFGAVDLDDLRRRSVTGEIVVLDVRPAAEFAAGHLPGAVHIPLDDLPDRLGELPTDREIVAYCRGTYCVLAHEAVRILISSGRRARRATDGILEWRAAGVPIARLPGPQRDSE